jgi:hypothetical protein
MNKQLEDLQQNNNRSHYKKAHLAEAKQSTLHA